MAFLIGVMLGTLKIPALEIVSNVSSTIYSIVPCFIVAIIAFVLIIVMETKFTN